MRRVNHLFGAVTSHENLMGSFRLALKGCKRTPSVCRFIFHLESELIGLQDALISGEYRPGGYRFFTIQDPKARIIAEAPFRDRVVHHAVVRVLTPVYERRFIYDSYATRVGKGTHASVRRAQQFVRKRPWYLKADIEKFFDSVDHGILMEIIERKIKDRRLLSLLRVIIDNAPVPGKGLPIGNLTSQFLANVYLDPLDHHVKETPRAPPYLRYMDDFVLFGHSSSEMLAWKERIETFLSDHLALRLHARATYINRSAHGLSFLGMRIFPNLLRLRPANRRRSLKHIRNRVRQWREGYITEERMAQSLTSIVGHLRFFQFQGLK